MSKRYKFGSPQSTFPVPNEIFILGLCPGELAVYAFLLHCENRKTHQCWPSYKTIGKAVGMSENTVAKHVASLERKGLIRTENTTVLTKAGIKRNGNLLYTIQPFQAVVDAHYQRQLDRAALDTAQSNWKAQSHECPRVAL